MRRRREEEKEEEKNTFKKVCVKTITLSLNSTLVRLRTSISEDNFRDGRKRKEDVFDQSDTEQKNQSN